MAFSHCKAKTKTKFDFLVFEFRWGVNRWGKPILKRRTSRDKLRASIVKFQNMVSETQRFAEEITF